MKSTTGLWIAGGIAAFILVNAMSRRVSATGEVQSLGTATGKAIGNAVGETTASTIWSIPSSYFNWFENKGEQLSEALWDLGDDNKLWS